MQCSNPKCQVIFQPKSSQQKYCSVACRNRHGQSIHRANGGAKDTCPDCGNLKERRAELCAQCRMIAWNQQSLGNKLTHDFQRFASIRQHARRMFKSHYKLCQCAICGYDTHVEVCHIKAIRDFPLDTPLSVVNDISNLVGLCPNHHWEYDHGKLILGIA